MPSSNLTFFQCFSENTAEKVHNLDTDQINVYLSNTAPNVATHTVKADIAEISTGSGYSGPIDTQNSTSRTGGVTSIVTVDILITATGAVGPFRYTIYYNVTAAGSPLIGYTDHGSAVTMANTDTYTIDFGASLFTITA